MTTLLLRVEQVLESLRPYLALDGGNVRVAALTKAGVLQLKWEGACEKCPVRSLTRAGIEDAIRTSIPQVTAVEAA